MTRRNFPLFSFSCCTRWHMNIQSGWNPKPWPFKWNLLSRATVKPQITLPSRPSYPVPLLTSFANDNNMRSWAEWIGRMASVSSEVFISVCRYSGVQITKETISRSTDWNIFAWQWLVVFPYAECGFGISPPNTVDRDGWRVTHVWIQIGYVGWLFKVYSWWTWKQREEIGQLYL